MRIKDNEKAKRELVEYLKKEIEKKQYDTETLLKIKDVLNEDIISKGWPTGDRPGKDDFRFEGPPIGVRPDKSE